MTQRSEQLCDEEMRIDESTEVRDNEQNIWLTNNASC